MTRVRSESGLRRDEMVRRARRASIEVALLEERVLLATDITPPTTTAAIVGTLGQNGFYVSPVTVNLTATDPDNTPSELTTTFTVNNGPVNVGNTINLTQSGTYTIAFQSNDPAGNIEATHILAIKVDTTAPTTTATTSGTLGKNGFFVSPVTVHLEATDPDNAAADLTTTFSVNGGPTMTGNTVQLNQDGIFTITFQSKDTAGNTEPTKTLVVKIDQTAPMVTMMVSPTTLWPPNHKFRTVTVTGQVTDNLSGPASPLFFHVVDEYGQVQPMGMEPVNPDGTFLFTVQLQASRLGQDRDGRTYEIFVTASDQAGNMTTVSNFVIVPHDQGHRSSPSLSTPSFTGTTFLGGGGFGGGNFTGGNTGGGGGAVAGTHGGTHHGKPSHPGGHAAFAHGGSAGTKHGGHGHSGGSHKFVAQPVVMTPVTPFVPVNTGNGGGGHGNGNGDGGGHGNGGGGHGNGGGGGDGGGHGNGGGGGNGGGHGHGHGG